LYENNVQKILVEFPGIQRNSSRTLLDEGRRNEVPDVWIYWSLGRMSALERHCVSTVFPVRKQKVHAGTSR
jgi:hypothetical protein